MRWALIGASDIAATQVLPALRQLGHEAVVVVGSDGERVARYATRHGVGRGTTSVEEALGSGGRSDIDAVYVSTTNERHAAGVHAAVGAGCHVLCEKPLATSLDQARAMVDAAAGAGVVLATNHHLRNSPVIRTLRGLVADGTLGRVLGVRVAHTNLLPERLRGWRLGSEAGAGVVLDLTVHDVDTVRSSPGWRCWRWRRSGWRGDVGGRGRRGRRGRAPYRRRHRGTARRVHHPARRSAVEVFGTDGLGVGHRRHVTDARRRRPPASRRTLDGVLVDIGERENLYVRGAAGVRRCGGGHGEPPCTGEDGVRSLAVALAVMESLTTGKRIRLV